MELSSRPRASCALLGYTTFRPGTWVSHASRLWQCWAAPPVPAPAGRRTTMGREMLPPNMKRILAAWLTSWSMATVRKSLNMSSAMGLRPVAALPTAAPMMAPSEIGVSRTRSGPNSSIMPALTPKQPPKAPTSSPNRSTLGFSRIRMDMASRIASP